MLKATIVHYGMPNLYVTISPDDTKNVIAYVFGLADSSGYSMNLTDIADVRERARMAASNPVALAQFFATVIGAILGKLFGFSYADCSGVLGPLRAHYGMVET